MMTLHVPKDQPMRIVLQCRAAGNTRQRAARIACQSAMRPGINMKANQDKAPAELAALACYATASESGICHVCDGVGLEEMVINERVKIIPCGRCGGTGDAEIIASRSHSL